jgi:SEC-C motif
LEREVVLDEQNVIRLRLGDDPSTSEKCLEALRELQEKISEVHTGSHEVFDFGLYVGQELEDTLQKRLGPLTSSCIWHAIALKFEFKLKLLHTIDGYLSAVDLKNPVSTFLLARHILELVATVSEIDFLLDECMEIDFRDWRGRAIQFLSVLYRARHSTSDEKFRSVFAQHGFQEEHLRPIRMKSAIKRLSTRHGFSSAKAMYDRLSNFCHHNGSGHKMLTESMRMTDVIIKKDGTLLHSDGAASAITFSYPSSSFSSNALALTARVTWWSAVSANRALETLRETPYTDRELHKLTRGRVTGTERFYRGTAPQSGKLVGWDVPKIGRNDLCPCGSGKKFKLCCAKTEP